MAREAKSNAPSAQKKSKASAKHAVEALSIVSQAAAIIGTIVAIVDALHRW